MAVAWMVRFVDVVAEGFTEHVRTKVTAAASEIQARSHAKAVAKFRPWLVVAHGSHHETLGEVRRHWQVLVYQRSDRWAKVTASYQSGEHKTYRRVAVAPDESIKDAIIDVGLAVGVPNAVLERTIENHEKRNEEDVFEQLQEIEFEMKSVG